MTDKIEKFDPATLMQGVKDRIKATFISMIPDENWNDMVQKEIDDFFKQTDRWGSGREYKSPFQLLCREVLNTEATNRLKAYLQTEEFNVIWRDNGSPVCSEQIRKFIIENSGAVLASMIGGLMASHLQNFQASINRTY